MMTHRSSKSLVRMLGADGFEVVAFASAREFLAAQDIEGIFCVVSDLRMPGVDGLELQQALHARLPHLSMVFITGHGDVPASVTAMKAGAVDFLEKPVKTVLCWERDQSRYRAQPRLARCINRNRSAEIPLQKTDRARARGICVSRGGIAQQQANWSPNGCRRENHQAASRACDVQDGS